MGIGRSGLMGPLDGPAHFDPYFLMIGPFDGLAYFNPYFFMIGLENDDTDKNIVY